MPDEQAVQSTGDRSELTGIIRDIRKRWRLKLALRGAMFVIGGAILALLLSAYSLEHLKFSPGSIIAFRIAMVMVSGALAWSFFVQPQWRKVTDEQVALYLEECEPTLETAILSALEAEKNSPDHSPALARRLVEQAIARCQAIEHGRRLEAQPLRRYASVIAGTIVAALLIFVLGPAYLRQGASALLRVSGSLVEASPYRIEVKPGSITVPRGSDQVISAKLQGFNAEQAELMIRKAVSAPFEHVPMVFNQDRLLHRVGRREVGGLHHARSRSAVREAARDGIRLPRVHGHRTSQDRKRRRYRRAAGHARAAAHHADDEVAVRQDSRRRRADCARAG
jgi:hypothetical protein